MPQNTESFPGKGMYRAGQCESVCEWVWVCASMNGVQDGAEASWPVNSIRLIIFTVRVRAGARGWTMVPRVAVRCWQAAAAVGRHRLTRCATKTRPDADLTSSAPRTRQQVTGQVLDLLLPPFHRLLLRRVAAFLLTELTRQFYPSRAFPGAPLLHFCLFSVFTSFFIYNLRRGFGLSWRP